jgi:hypothetical protein
MKIEFNLSGLKDIYLEALKRSEPTLAFEILNGRGRFLFLMFFSQEDKGSKDRLFVLLRNTQVFLKLKAYGSHREGNFLIYFQDHDQQAIIRELDLSQGDSKFDFTKFLEQLNVSLPSTLSLQDKLNKVREVWPQVKNELQEVIDDADKNILIGIKRLPLGQNPKEKTLRKLYIYTNGNSQVISQLIAVLKSARITLAWTNNPNVASKSINEIMKMVNSL